MDIFYPSNVRSSSTPFVSFHIRFTPKESFTISFREISFLPTITEPILKFNSKRFSFAKQPPNLAIVYSMRFPFLNYCRSSLGFNNIVPWRLHHFPKSFLGFYIVEDKRFSLKFLFDYQEVNGDWNTAWVFSIVSKSSSLNKRISRGLING